MSATAAVATVLPQPNSALRAVVTNRRSLTVQSTVCDDSASAKVRG